MSQYLVAFWLIAISCNPLPVAAEQQETKDELGPREILERMAAVYAECDTYQDKVAIDMTMVLTDKTFSYQEVFTTVFVRPDQFRFTYQTIAGDEQDPLHIVWRKGDQVLIWYGYREKIIKKDSLHDAIAPYAGITLGISHIVPPLLLPEEEWPIRGLLNLAITTLEEDGAQDGAACYRVQGILDFNELMCLWIDKITFLLRRLDVTRKFNQKVSEFTVIYKPVLNEEVPVELLEFNAPKSVPEEVLEEETGEAPVKPQ